SVEDAAAIKRVAADHWNVDPSECRLADDAVSCGARRLPFTDLIKAGGPPLTAQGNSQGTPRSVAFNVQGFRVAVNKYTGVVRILKSVQAADAGRVANPMQCRGQIEGGVAQSLGAALYEEIVIDETGRVINPRFRDYHLPSYADVPRTEVLFAETTDTIGPLGAKSMSESPYNPVSAALGNALRAATGIRFTATPFKPDRLFPLLQEKFGA
ncbi:MAG: molybdopterin cofactor-binding domain-containing protein, partial [Bradyrhizobium sp.]|nr:molybdopterin cofactor-binding domain-containing protein [Bradyrhizobium sp.]